MYLYIYMYMLLSILFYCIFLQLSDALHDTGFEGVDPLGHWWNTLRNKIDFNTKLSQVSYII